MKGPQYKYHESTTRNKLKTSQQLGFLEYYMLPQADEFEYVYRPGDDSFLLLSVLKQELPDFPHHSVICEVGSGSGIISAHLHKWLVQTGKQPIVHYATDISMDACQLSQKYYAQYGLTIEQLCTSLTKGIRVAPNIIICNPPYVPTEAWEKQSEAKYLHNKLEKCRNGGEGLKRSPQTNLIAYSYMGGPEGLDTTRLLIQSIGWECKLYVIIMGEEGLDRITEQVKSGKVRNQKISKGEVEVLQKYQKMNEELFVVLIHLS